MASSYKSSLNVLEELSKFVEGWSAIENQNEEHINELLLEFDLVVYRLNEHANELKDDYYLEICELLNKNLEAFHESLPSQNQIELVCAWPMYLSEFLTNRDDQDVNLAIKDYLNNSNWVSTLKTNEAESSQILESSLISQMLERDEFKPDEEEILPSASSTEQQEFLDLLNAEVLEIHETQAEKLAILNEPEISDEVLREVIETQADQIERIGSAAELMGLHGLYIFCSEMINKLAHIKNTDPNQLIQLQEQVLIWPDVVQGYLFALDDQDYIQAAIDYLMLDAWPIKLSSDELKNIKEAFCNSEIEVDHSQEPERIREATAENISLDIPEDVPDDLVNSLLVDLPTQTAEFSDAVQNLRSDDFIAQLEVAKRIAHTLKGAGNTVGIKGLANLTHNLEDILEALLKASAKPTKNLIKSIQNAADCIEEMSEFLQGSASVPQDSIRVFQEVLNWANHIDDHGIPKEGDQHDETVEPDTDNTIVQVIPSQEKITEDKPQQKDTSGEASLRISAHLVDELLKHTDECMISNAQIQEFISRSLDYAKQMRSNNNKIKTLVQELEHIIEIRGFSSRHDGNSNDKKFDPLEMDQFNELHTYTNQLMESSADSIEFLSNLESSLLKLDNLSNHQERILLDNQDAVLNTRMVPVNSVTSRLKRSVRQACKLANKTAELEIIGGDTLIDSDILNQLVDPIMHLLRNAVDHGIESSEYRIKQNKPPEGKIQLSFKKEGKLISVICNDDGYGIDIEQIKEKALERDIISDNDDLSKEEAMKIILRHGFSTKEQVSQLSGRGVGLDVVYANIRKMKGAMTLDSETGHGLRVELSIPTSFHTTHALLVSSAGNTIAVSNRNVEEILYPGSGTVHTDSDKSYFQYQQERYPVFDLHNMLYENRKQLFEENEYATLIVKDELNFTHAVIVDKILDTRDVVIKPFSRFIPKITGLLGTTILGDGSVTTVIDIVELINKPSHEIAKSTYDVQHLELEEQHKLVLIVEDAISTRNSLAMYMQDLGFDVVTAKDGVEAINHIQNQLPALVLTDLEMPRMNGLELTDHLRANEKTQNIPIIMITSRSTEKHKQEAERIGVSAYMTKPYDEDKLLSLIQNIGVITTI